MAFENMLIRNVQNHYGPRSTDLKFGSKVGSTGQVKTAVWTFDYDDLPVASTTNEMIQEIPTGSYILEATFQVITAFASGTSYDIDIVERDGTAIGTGEDKLWDALAVAEIDTTEVIAALKSSTHAGTNSGNALMGVTDAVGVLQVVASGTFTAGRARIAIDYLTVPPA
jgi:hypothetical protein